MLAFASARPKLGSSKSICVSVRPHAYWPSAATAWSQAMASIVPAARQWPVAASTVGRGSVHTRIQVRPKRVSRSRTPSCPAEAMNLTFSPAVSTPGRPVTTIARTSSPASSKAARMASKASGSKAFLAPSSMVSVRMPSSRSRERSTQVTLAGDLRA